MFIFTNKKGFSVLELIVIITIMGSLSAMAGPAYQRFLDGAKRASYEADVNDIYQFMRAYGEAEGTYCVEDLRTVGLEDILRKYSSQNKVGPHGFIGFGGTSCNGIRLTKGRHYGSVGSSNVDEQCVIHRNIFRVGVIGNIKVDTVIGISLHYNSRSKHTAINGVEGSKYTYDDACT